MKACGAPADAATLYRFLLALDLLEPEPDDLFAKRLTETVDRPGDRLPFLELFVE